MSDTKPTLTAREQLSKYEWLGFSLNSIIMIGIGVLVLGTYIGVLIFGENSLVVLNRLQREQQSLKSERKQLQSSNQKLQKEYFELKQLTSY